MIFQQAHGLGAINNPCDSIANATTREACKIALQTHGPDAVAQYLTAKGGEAACVAAGAGVIAPLCGKAAQKVYDWIFADYTPNEKAEILWRAAQGVMYDSIFAFEKMAIPRFGTGYQTPGLTYDPWKTALANLRTNLKLLGYGEVWKRDKATAAGLILLGMITKGVAGKDLIWWRVKVRTAADLSPLAVVPGTTPASQPAALAQLPPGAITAWSAKMRRWRLAVPRGGSLSGFGEGTLLTSPSFWLTAGVVVLASVGGYYLLKKRRSRRRRAHARATWATVRSA